MVKVMIPDEISEKVSVSEEGKRFKFNLLFRDSEETFTNQLV
jgi:hypothetical protein